MAETSVDEFLEAGQDAGRGNLLGVQPYLTPRDYASLDSFCTRLGSYLEAAREKGWLSERTVAVFPEYVGTWLVAAGEKEAVYSARSTAEAMRPLALGRPLRFLGALLAGREKDRVTAGIFRSKAAQTARLYQDAFSGLAQQFQITIVAGSVLLPEPRVEDGRLAVRTGALYNVSAVFKPDGSLHPQLSRKIFPLVEELSFIGAGAVEDLPVFETPAGRLGVLVCADSWYPAPYRELASKGIDLLAVPSFATGNDHCDIPWGGYNGADAPQDVDPGDVGRLTEGQAWRKYALSGRMAQSGARAGVNVFLHGALWDLGSNSGLSLGVSGGEACEVKSKGAAIINLWV
jgi:predicted amidohydrolase